MSENNRIYEVGYLVLPTVGNEGVRAVTDRLKKIITTAEGTHLSSQEAELIELAYAMSKVIENKRQEFDTAYFGWFKFTGAPEKLEAIKKALDNDESLLRYLLVKTVAEDTMVNPRAIFARPVEDVQEVIASESPFVDDHEEVNEKELDESLDILLVDEKVVDEE